MVLLLSKPWYLFSVGRFGSQVSRRNRRPFLTCCRKNIDKNNNPHRERAVQQAIQFSTMTTDDSSSTCRVIQGPSLLQTGMARPNPSLMILPGLRSLPFWTTPSTNDGDTRKPKTRIAYSDPLVAHVVDYLESHVETIRQEYLLKASNIPNDYQDVGSEHQTLNTTTKTLHKGDWKWNSFLNKGSVVGQFCMDFPGTAAILQELRKQHILFEGIPFGFCFFSTLGPQSSIEAHTGPMNLRLRIHLPLIVPKPNNDNENENFKDKDENDETLPKCGIRVGPIVQEWVEKQAMVLDDSFNHQVWNHYKTQHRVLLLLDIWHPDISPMEKQEIVQMFQTAKQKGLW